MAEQQKQIIVEQRFVRMDRTSGAPVRVNEYVVYEALNTTEPELYESLSKEQVDNLILSGIKVKIKASK